MRVYNRLHLIKGGKVKHISGILLTVVRSKGFRYEDREYIPCYDENDVIKDYAKMDLESVHTDDDIRIFNKFTQFFDGSTYYDESPLGNCSTYLLGVTKLKMINGVLNVWLRRPGSLIGAGGIQIDKLQKHLECEVHVYEVVNLWD